MFLTSPGKTGWIGGFADVFRIWIELATSRLVAGVPSGQLNFVARLIAKSLASPEESKTGPYWPFSGRFGGFLLIRDLLILNIFESSGLSFPRKDSHSEAL